MYCQMSTRSSGQIPAKREEKVSKNPSLSCVIKNVSFHLPNFEPLLDFLATKARQGRLTQDTVKAVTLPTFRPPLKRLPQPVLPHEKQTKALSGEEKMLKLNKHQQKINPEVQAMLKQSRRLSEQGRLV